MQNIKHLQKKLFFFFAQSVRKEDPKWNVLYEKVPLELYAYSKGLNSSAHLCSLIRIFIEYLIVSLTLNAYC